MILKKFLTVMQVLLICVCIGCGLYLVKYYRDSSAAREGFEELRKEVREHTITDASGAYVEQYTEDGNLVKYDSLYEKNHDFRGWLKIDGTSVDYPVVQADDNEYYLHRDFYGKYQYSGIPFLDCQSTEHSQNLIIYAHNMKDGSMFADISKYSNKDFYESHGIIHYDTLFETGDYEIISVFKATIGSPDEFKYNEYANILSEDEFDEYMSLLQSHSIYTTGKTASYGDRLLTLSTCAYGTDNERIVLAARKIQ